MEENEFDLFKLHTKEDRTPRLWICAIGKNLHDKLDGIIEEIIEKKGLSVIYVKVKKEILQEIYDKAILKANTQQNLAKILDVPRQDLYKWRECKRKIPISILIRLIEYIEMNFCVNEMVLEKRSYDLGINRQKISQIIAEKLNTKLNFPEKIIYMKRKEIALIFIIELLGIWKDMLNKSDKELEEKKIEIQKTIEFFKQNTPKQAVP